MAGLNDTETEVLKTIPCYLYNADFPENWGNCCEELSVSPKPLWFYFVVTIPIEAIVSSFNRRADGKLYERKRDISAIVFIFFNLLNLVLIAAKFDWTGCLEHGNNNFDCYQGFLFSIYNSTGGVGALTLWSVVLARKAFPFLYSISRTIIFPSQPWDLFEASSDSMSSTHEQLLLTMYHVSNDTKLYWYDIVAICLALVFGGVTHVLPMLVTYWFYFCTLIIALVLTHFNRLSFLRMSDSDDDDLKSVLFSFLLHVLNLIQSFVLVTVFPLYAIYAFPKYLYSQYNAAKVGTGNSFVRSLQSSDGPCEFKPNEYELSDVMTPYSNQALKFLMDLLEKFCLFDAEKRGRVILFAGGTFLMVFTTTTNYAIMLYSGAPYGDVMNLELNARDQMEYASCVIGYFEDHDFYGIVDFIAFAMWLCGCLVHLGEFVHFLCLIRK